VAGEELTTAATDPFPTGEILLGTVVTMSA
jgi:hypothetical protein